MSVLVGFALLGALVGYVAGILTTLYVIQWLMGRDADTHMGPRF